MNNETKEIKENIENTGEVSGPGAIKLKTPFKLLGFIIDKIKRPTPRKWTFVPKEDITAYELSLLLPFLFTSGRPGIMSSDMEYLKENNLLRHLIIEDAIELLPPNSAQQPPQ